MGALGQDGANRGQDGASGDSLGKSGESSGRQDGPRCPKRERKDRLLNPPRGSLLETCLYDMLAHSVQVRLRNVLGKHSMADRQRFHRQEMRLKFVKLAHLDAGAARELQRFPL